MIISIKMAATSEQDGEQIDLDGLRSDVWKHFKRLEIERKAMCMLCHKKLSYRGGTTNLREHLTSKHPLQYVNPKKSSEKESKQSKIDTYVRSEYCSDKLASEITERIADMVALDLRPISSVEGEGFRDLLACIQPGYKPPSRKHITRILKRKHDVGKAQLKVKLQEALSIAITTDLWSSLATESYITVSVHYLSTDWKMCSYVLETSGFPERHTGENIANKLSEIGERYELNDKVSTVVHDHAANMMCALRMLHDRHGWESSPCAAHRLQLCLIPGLAITAIDRLVVAARKLVGHFKHSTLATQELEKRQLQMNIEKKKLINDCATRWNSTFYMLERLIELRWPVTAVLSDDRVTKRSDRSLDLKGDQWVLAEQLVKVLHPIEVATAFLSSEENASLSCVLPVMYGLVDALKTVSDLEDELPAIRSFRQKTAKDISDRWGLDSLDTTSSLVLAAAVDPRFKQLRFLNEGESESVKEEMTKRMDEVIMDITCTDDGDEVTQPTTKKRKTALDVLLGEEDESNTTTVDTRDELDMFFSERPVARKTNPIIWWRENFHRYPHLAKVAQSILNIPATSTPAERIFSKAGMIDSKLRSSLKPSTVDCLIFLNKNMKLLV